MKQVNQFEERQDAPLYYVGQVSNVKLSLKSSLAQWRISRISTTRLAALIPLLVTVFRAVWLLVV